VAIGVKNSEMLSCIFRSYTSDGALDTSFVKHCAFLGNGVGIQTAVPLTVTQSCFSKTTGFITITGPGNEAVTSDATKGEGCSENITNASPNVCLGASFLPRPTPLLIHSHIIPIRTKAPSRPQSPNSNSTKSSHERELPFLETFQPVMTRCSIAI
jgi:hypothetical protein